MRSLKSPKMAAFLNCFVSGAAAVPYAHQYAPNTTFTRGSVAPLIVLQTNLERLVTVEVVDAVVSLSKSVGRVGILESSASLRGSSRQSLPPFCTLFFPFYLPVLYHRSLSSTPTPQCSHLHSLLPLFTIGRPFHLQQSHSTHI